MCERVVYVIVVHVHVEISIHTGRVFDGTPIWIVLLISLVAVTEEENRK